MKRLAHLALAILLGGLVAVSFYGLLHFVWFFLFTP